jgi:fluoroacetyl-CoA thioesterase
MELNLKPGVTATERILIESDRSIAFMGEAARVYSTPSMVSDVEYACLRLIQKHLDEQQSSVGMHVSVDHLAPTPLGCEVEVSVTVSAVDGRKVTLDARVRDAVEVVGTGVHVRFVIDVPRQVRRIEEKKKLLESRVGAGRPTR